MLDDDPDLRAVCGFDDKLPSDRTFNYAFSRLKQFPELVARCMATVLDWFAEERGRHDQQVKKADPEARIRPFGSELNVDSTVIRSESVYKKEGGSSDPEASLGFAHKRGVFIRRKGSSTPTPEPVILKFGYRAQVVFDSNSGFPIAMDFDIASSSDNPALIPLMKRTLEEHPGLKPRSLSGDMGYNALYNRNWLEKRGIAAVINWPKQTTHSGLIDDQYDLDGRPFCTGKQKMEFKYYDEANGDLVYGCPEGGCHLKGSLRGGARHCEDLHPVSKDSVVYCSIPPASPQWKRLRKRGWTLEGFYSKVKGKMPLERHHLRGVKNVQLHAMLNILTYQLKEYIKAREGRWDELRKMRQKRRNRKGQD